MISRRRFLQLASGAPAFLAGYHGLAAAGKGRSKIRDIQTMVVQARERTPM